MDGKYDLFKILFFSFWVNNFNCFLFLTIKAFACSLPQSLALAWLILIYCCQCLDESDLCSLTFTSRSFGTTLWPKMHFAVCLLLHYPQKHPPQQQDNATMLSSTYNYWQRCLITAVLGSTQVLYIMLNRPEACCIRTLADIDLIEW